jgi:hypothetical protein
MEQSLLPIFAKIDEDERKNSKASLTKRRRRAIGKSQAFPLSEPEA